MIKIYLATIFLVTATTCYSQNPDDSVMIKSYSSLEFLIPVNNYAQFINSDMLMNSIRLDKNEEIILQFISLPSFDKTSVTSIIHNFKDNIYKIQHNYWKKGKIKIRENNAVTKQREINTAIAKQINQIYENMLIKVHYPKTNKNFDGMDGTIYQFYVNGEVYGQMYGQTWSPKDGTNTDYLVKASQLLSQFVNNKIDEQKLKLKLLDFKSKILNDQMKQSDYLDMYSMCDSELIPPFIAYGSIAIQELAQDKKLEEFQVGGVLTIWRLKACDLLDNEIDLLDSTLEAIGNECKEFIQLSGTNEQDYILETNKILKNKEASVAVLSWAVKRKNSNTSSHVVIASDGNEEMRVEYKGYGYINDNAKSFCKKSQKGVIKFTRY